MAPLHPYLPPPPAQVLDVGAGPGRDAEWFRGLGYEVTAVEPVAAFRDAGRGLTGPAVSWVDDRLPALDRIDRPAGGFSVILVMAVWQHLTREERPLALRRLADLSARGGCIGLPLRIGPGAPGRPVYPIDVGAFLTSVKDVGLTVLQDIEVASKQPENRAAGVSWRWMVLETPR